MADIDKVSRKYMAAGACCVCVLLLLCFAAGQLFALGALLTVPAVVSAAFTLLIYIAEAMLWRRIAMRSPESLPTFFTACSGFRLLLALAVMMGYYLAVGRDAMLPFFLVFMAFYATMLVHHSVFFARVSNRS